MLVIVGFFVVMFSVFGGFVLHGGKMHVMVQPTEWLIIGGAAIGSLLTASPVSLIKNLMKHLIHSITGKGVGKGEYNDLLMLLFELFKMGRGNLLGLEEHIENPENSAIFSKYTTVMKNHHAVEFICDTLKVQISSPMSPYDLEDLMDTDMNTAHHEEEKVPTELNRVADSFPGLGIVAAVLGIVITMGKLSDGKEAIGHSVAAALVGTFLGILLCYGVVQPLAVKIAGNIAEEGKFLQVIKAGMLAFAKDASPKVCVEFARRSIPPELRPTFSEVDEATSNLGKAA